jgi:beta-glucanase (GH16 family)
MSGGTGRNIYQTSLIAAVSAAALCVAAFMALPIATTLRAVHPVAACVPLDPTAIPGWRLSFEENFSKLDAFNGASGRWQTHLFWGQRTIVENGEKQIYVDPAYSGVTPGAPLGLNPFTIDDGGLTIAAWEADARLRAKLGATDARYLSGMLMTAGSFRQTYGYFEINAKMPAGKGLWPAFWLLPSGGRWPPEIDVLEVFGQDPGTLYVSVHSAETGHHVGTTKTVPVPDTSLDFHRFGVLWTAGSLIWYFDGCPVAELPTPADLHGPMYLLLNLAVGGTWPGYPDEHTHFPAKFQVKYVRAFAVPPQ